MLLSLINYKNIIQSMVVIFGNGPKYFIEAEGKFICPKCNFIKKYGILVF